VLDQEVAPAFTEYDAAALRDQNRYPRQQVIIRVLMLASARDVMPGERVVASREFAFQARSFPSTRAPRFSLGQAGSSASLPRLTAEGKVRPSC
jgi:hypothetical protein